MKKIISFVFIFTLIFTFSACSKAQEAESTTASVPADRISKIKAAGKMVIGTSADYPPFEFHAEIDGEDTITGIDIMIGKYIADSLGVEMEIVDMSFDGLLISLDEGKFDLVLAGMSPNEERLQAADFSDETIHLGWDVIIRKADEAKYSSKEDFVNSKVGVQRATVYKAAAIDLVGEENVVELVKFGDLITELQNGKIDAIVANNMTTYAYAIGNSDLLSKDVGIVNTEPGQAVAIKKGEAEWLEYINGELAKMRGDGSIDKFIEESVKLAEANGMSLD